MRWRVKPGHAGFGRAMTNRQVLVVCAHGAAELFVVALVTTARWKRRWEKNGESRGRKGRDWARGGRRGRGVNQSVKMNVKNK